MTCAALLSLFFHGVTIEQLDRSRVYEVPASVMESMSGPQRFLARGCARRHQIKYRITE